jgi:hypothetical protein
MWQTARTQILSYATGVAGVVFATGLFIAVGLPGISTKARSVRVVLAHAA